MVQRAILKQVSDAGPQALRSLTPAIEKLAADKMRRLSWRQWLQYGPFLAQLVITRRCNLSCGYCYEYDKTSQPVRCRVLERRLAKLRQLRTWVVCLVGGEPTLHPDLLRLVAKMRDLGFRRRQVITNGFRLTRELIEGFNAAGLTDLQLSVDGVRCNKTTVKVLQVLRGRLELLSRLANFPVVLNAVIGAAPPEEAIDVVEFARSHGFQPRIVLIHDENGQIKLSPRELDVYREVKKRIGSAAEEAGDYRERLMEKGVAPFRCRAGARYLYVDEFGEVHRCSQTKEQFSKHLFDFDLADLKRQFQTKKPCNSRCSIGCARTASAFDEWRAQRLSFVDPGVNSLRVMKLQP